MRESLYDAIPYPSSAHVHTHPDGVAVLGTLFGLRPAAPAGCRLLEIGCGDGGNLLPMAAALPGARFVGIDSSSQAIGRARAAAAALELDNVAFEEVAIEDFAADAQSFDYAVAHGVFSWVPEHVRAALLGLCAHVLADHGIAFVSYNALPGARVPQTLRELLLLQLEGIDDHAERIAEARRLLALLSGSNQQATMLGAEAADVLGHSDAALFHDTLAPINDAYLFSDFAALAAAQGLQYVAEAHFLEMQMGHLPPEIQRELLAGTDVVRREQLLDYLKVRRFRQTLLCRAEVQLQRGLSLERITEFAVSSPARASADPQNPAAVTFESPDGARLTSDHALVVPALQRIAASWPAAVPIAELLGGDTTTVARDTLCEALLRSYAANLVALHVAPPALSARAGERPRVSTLARMQARAHARATNLRHATIDLDEELARLVPLLDGTRDRAALEAELGGDGDALDAALARAARAALLLP